MTFWTGFVKLSKQNENSLNAEFFLFLNSLGSIVDVKRHHGWTGNFETSWKIVQPVNSSNETHKKPTSMQISELNGLDYILYWSDITSEIAFILPNTSKPLATDLNLQNSNSPSQNLPPAESSDMQNLAQTQSEEAPKKIQFYAGEVKLIVVWLEQMQDLESIPTSRFKRTLFFFMGLAKG
jgi:hypothetical protein